VQYGGTYTAPSFWLQFSQRAFNLSNPAAVASTVPQYVSQRSAVLAVGERLECYDLNRESAGELAKGRAANECTQTAFRGEVVRLLGLPEKRKRPAKPRCGQWA